MTGPTGALRVTDRALLILTIALVAALLVAAGIAWRVTYQPALTPVEVPSVTAA